MQMKRFIVAVLAVVGMSLFGQAASAGSVAQNGAAVIERQVADASQSAVTQVRFYGHRHGGGRFFRGGRWYWGAPFAFYGAGPYGYGYSPYWHCRRFHGPRYCHYHYGY